MSTQILFRTDEGIKRIAAARAKRSGVPLSKVLGAFIAAYAAGNVEVSVDIAVRTVGPEAPLKSREEMKAMPHDEWKSYVASLSERQREELWQRDDAPFVTAETIRSLDRQMEDIASGREKTRSETDGEKEPRNDGRE